MEIIATTTTIVPDLDSKQPEPEDPTRIHPAKPISFSNGKHSHPHHHHHHPPPLIVFYKECLKNHAASIGGHALDGCGEFMPSPSFNPNEPTSLTCVACGCHRNFHRREQDPPPPSSTAIIPALDFFPHNRHQLPPPPPPPHRDEDDSASPPPISSSYMLLALSGRGGGRSVVGSGPMMTRKRFRTKFSQFQKEKMFEFAERVGWKMPKSDDVDVKEFCREIGVNRSVFKVWMHNNKISGRSGGAKRACITGGGEGGEGEGGETVVVPTMNGSVSST